MIVRYPWGRQRWSPHCWNLISVKEGYRDVAEYLLSDVVVVQDLRSGLALWHRNGYYSTLVTPEGEVIDPMGVVTGRQRRLAGRQLLKLSAGA